MPHYLPADFEIDTNPRTVTPKASGRKYWWDRSSEMGDATHYHHRSEGHTDISLRDSHNLIRYAFKALREEECAVIAAGPTDTGRGARQPMTDLTAEIPPELL